MKGNHIFAKKFFLQDLKKAFAVGVNFCWEQRRINLLLIEGFRAAQWVIWAPDKYCSHIPSYVVRNLFCFFRSKWCMYLITNDTHSEDEIVPFNSQISVMRVFFSSKLFLTLLWKWYVWYVIFSLTSILSNSATDISISAFSVFVGFFFPLKVEICLAFSIYRISLLHLNSRLGQLKNDVATELKKLEAKVDFFNSR